MRRTRVDNYRKGWALTRRLKQCWETRYPFQHNCQQEQRGQRMADFQDHSVCRKVTRFLRDISSWTDSRHEHLRCAANEQSIQAKYPSSPPAEQRSRVVEHWSQRMVRLGVWYKHDYAILVEFSDLFDEFWLSLFLVEIYWSSIWYRKNVL